MSNQNNLPCGTIQKNSGKRGPKTRSWRDNSLDSPVDIANRSFGANSNRVQHSPVALPTTTTATNMSLSFHGTNSLPVYNLSSNNFDLPNIESLPFNRRLNYAVNTATTTAPTITTTTSSVNFPTISHIIEGDNVASNVAINLPNVDNELTPAFDD